ncbi:crotonase/enoyl-CoA hydratase family protein [Microbaculum marinum]|uniref:Crotonase/enoyl-CoA hydratase family protein n=1 Tax=Microbaculum marinum TaxID=1764581 RepID=A0AAW9RIV5_9HYPH
MTDTQIDFKSVRYETAGRIATITLDRPDRLNAIDRYMPQEIEAAVKLANGDDAVHVIILTGAGRAFCAGYDLQEFAEGAGTNPGIQDMPWDPMLDFKFMYGNTQAFMSLHRSYKPTIAKIRGFAVAGGSDIATCCDLIVMAEDARIGYPPARIWGCPSVGLWAFRVGAQRAKRMLFTGDLIDGRTAVDYGLAIEAVPAVGLDDAVQALAGRIAGVPKNQLMMSKLMVNSALENQGLTTTQQFATLFDGITRHSPEGVWWKERAETVGFKQAVQERDSGDPIAADAEKTLPDWPSHE